MNQIKLIATDLDGTLLADRQTLLENDKNALLSVKKAGCTLCFATGRELGVITPMMDKFQLWNIVDYFIMSGGAQIYDVKAQKIIYQSMLTSEMLNDVYNRYKHLPISALLIRDNIFHTNRITDGLLNEGKLLGFPVKSHDKFNLILDKPATKIVFHGTVPEIETALLEMNNDTDERFSLCRSQDHYIDCQVRGVHKGSALKKLCEILGISTDEAAAIGDEANDIEILETAGFSGCPLSASDDVKNIADFICRPAYEGAFSDFWGKLIKR